MLGFYGLFTVSFIIQLHFIYSKPKQFLGALSLTLRKFKCDPREVRSLVNLLPIMMAHTRKIFESIITKLPTHKFYVDKDTVVMHSLAYPKSELENFYGLRKSLMPFPAYYVQYPPLR